MPRRPRPAYRPAPRTPANQLRPTNSPNKSKSASRTRFTDPEPEDSEQEDALALEDGFSSEEFEEGSSQDSAIDKISENKGEDEHADADAPRIAQWEGDDEDGVFQESNDVEVHLPLEKSLRGNLQDLPLGALRRAQRVLSQAELDSDPDSGSESGSSSAFDPETQDTKGESKEKVEWSTKPRNDISKRPNKHAPMEITSKKPVTRRRIVVEVPKIVPRDPRFLPTAGQFSAEKFHKQYNFLAENHKTELSTLQETLKKARKMLASSPRDLRSERGQEVDKLERAVKRAESMVNKDRLDQVEREAMSNVKKEEKEKRAQGKKAWHLKKGEKQKLVVQARYEALAKEGGQRAVKKAIEKRQKKVSQREKRSRPFAKGEGKRLLAADGGQPNAKRRRVA